MKAPTNVTGPDGTVCRRGEEIPADWFDELPDLADHLAAIPEPGETGTETASSTVRADLLIDRQRNSS